MQYFHSFLLVLIVVLLILHYQNYQATEVHPEPSTKKKPSCPPLPAILESRIEERKTSNLVCYLVVGHEAERWKSWNVFDKFKFIVLNSTEDANQALLNSVSSASSCDWMIIIPPGWYLCQVQI